ncbi:MAG: hypothetical protein J6W10_09490 [Kiritimatiellae bacterium]|nr:hypothetical protein [Kiritimatiellia bacterium]
MKKLLVFSVAVIAAVFAATTADAQNARRNTRNARTGTRAGGMQVGQTGPAAASAKVPRVRLDRLPKAGRASTLAAPAIPGGSIIGKCYMKDRRWIVLESKYETYEQWTDRLVFTWHVLLETSTATEGDRKERGSIPPYSYFSTTVSYVNIPRGSHAAGVCLPPSYLERYGEPKAVGLVITSPEGEVLAGDSESEISGIKSHTMWWNDASIMDSKGRNGEPMIERRQGLVDRSKTIWALVNPNDYEDVAQ